MTALITAFLQLANSAAQYMNIQAGASPHINKLASIRDQILEEEKKGYDSDDVKIENLLAQVKIETDAIQALLQAIPPAHA